MAQNLTLQVREIASVTKAVDIGASGEIRELKMTVNSMVSRRVPDFSRGLERVGTDSSAQS